MAAESACWRPESLVDHDGVPAELSESTLQALNAVLPPTWSHGNPVDIIGDANGERYAAALEALLKEPGKDAVLILNCPTAVADSLEAAQSVVSVLGEATARTGADQLAGRRRRGGGPPAVRRTPHSDL